MLGEVLAAAAAESFSSQITQYLPLIGVVAGALIIEGSRAWNRRKGNMETRAPSVNELWAQQAKQNEDLEDERRARRKLGNQRDAARTHARDVERMYRLLREGFRSFVRRAQSGGSLELTADESQLLRAEIPPMPEETQDG